MKIDKVCLFSILISFILLISAYGFFIENNGFNDRVAEKMAVGLSMINPADSSGPSFERQSQLYLNENRAIVLIYIASIILAVLSLARAIALKISAVSVHNVGILITASIGLIISNIYLVLTSGVLVDV